MGGKPNVAGAGGWRTATALWLAVVFVVLVGSAGEVMPAEAAARPAPVSRGDVAATAPPFERRGDEAAASLPVSPRVDDATVVAPPGLVVAIEVTRDGRVQALPLDRRYLRLQAGDRDLRIRLRTPADAAVVPRYRLRLEGHDDGWRDVRWPAEVGYDALSPGPQRLWVTAAQGDGWSAPEERVLLVDSPWWQTRVLVAVASVALLAALGWLAWRSRLQARRRAVLALATARRELAESHSEAKSRFLASLGHEIRTPLTGVLGMAELLQDGTLDPRQRRRVEAIQGAGRHLLQLVNDALDLARIEAGRLPLASEPFALRPLLDDVAELLRPLAEAKGLAFVLQCSPALPPALAGDATRLRQILFNLGHNAIKFSEHGGVAVQADVPPEGGLRLSVRDSGPGLDAERRARLFQRFEPGTGSGGSGAGLGLAICRELAVAMGGGIDVHSVPGQGARFDVTLPLAAAALPVAAATAAAPVARGLRVLLVEDDLLVADVVRGLLQRLGHDTVHAAHGLAALSELECGAFDVAVLDLDLPGIDGLVLAGLVRARWQLPLLALTARADADAEPSARAAGMQGFLRKPVTAAMLADALAALRPQGEPVDAG